ESAILFRWRHSLRSMLAWSGHYKRQQSGSDRRLNYREIPIALPRRTIRACARAAENIPIPPIGEACPRRQAVYRVSRLKDPENRSKVRDVPSPTNKYTNREYEDWFESGDQC